MQGPSKHSFKDIQTTMIIRMREDGIMDNADWEMANMIF